jgi:hypothetical protein
MALTFSTLLIQYKSEVNSALCTLELCGEFQQVEQFLVFELIFY